MDPVYPILHLAVGDAVPIDDLHQHGSAIYHLLYLLYIPDVWSLEAYLVVQQSEHRHRDLELLECLPAPPDWIHFNLLRC